VTTNTAALKTPTTLPLLTVFSAISSLASPQQRKRSALLGLRYQHAPITSFLNPPPIPTVQTEPTKTEQPDCTLLEFVAEAWPILEPATGYQHNWHIDVVAAHLEAISRGELQDLLVNIPPGFMKSLMVSVFWPAWEWTWLPWTRWLFTSYDQALAMRDALKTRRLIESEWYQQRWGKTFRLTTDQNTKTRYENDKTGLRIASSIGGLATGEHCHRRIGDDLHKVREAESDLERENVLTTWKETMTSRGIPTSPLNARVMVMQRVHELDVAADWLDRESHVHHICLPNEYESSSPPISMTDQSVCPIVEHDQRTLEGALLWPAMVDQAETERLKTTKLGPYAYAGQFQQTPTPRVGMVLDPSWIQQTPDNLALSTCDLIMAWDLNYSSRDASDWTVGMVAAVDHDPELPKIHIVDVFRQHLASKQHDQEIANWITLWKPILVGIERRAWEQQGVTEDLIRLVMIRLERVHVGTTIEPVEADADKLSRAMIIPGRASGGLIFANKRAPWWSELSRELSTFPKGHHDDQVDCLAYLVRLVVEKLSMVRAQQALLGHSSRMQYVSATPPPTVDPKWGALLGGAR